MSGPREPWRSRALSRNAQERERQAWLWNLRARTNGERTDLDLPDDVGPIVSRETRPRDRSLHGKARRNARKAARA